MPRMRSLKRAGNSSVSHSPSARAGARQASARFHGGSRRTTAAEGASVPSQQHLCYPLLGEAGGVGHAAPRLAVKREW